MTYQEAVVTAEARNKDLLAIDFSTDSVVHVQTDDGCAFFWTSAFYEPVSGPNGVHKYIIVYTEHYGYHLFHVSDITVLYAGTREY